MIIRTVLIVALALGLAACGRKGMPEFPEDTTYPHDYPYTPMPTAPKTRTNEAR